MMIRLEDTGKELGFRNIALLCGAALLLASIRPHIPIMIGAAYGAATLATYLFKLPKALLIRRVTILVCLAVSMLPAVLYSVWVSQQPVWSSFAAAHPDAVHDWAIGFLLLWILGGVGTGVLGARALQSPFAFLICWSLGAGILLLVLNGHLYPKICAGFTIALALLAGVAIERYMPQLKSRLLLAGTTAALAFLALASSAITMLDFARYQRTAAASELFQVIDVIRKDAGTAFPAVFTDCGTGTLLPGLGGYQVPCGHWALTDNNRQKIVLLSSIGFVADGQSLPGFPGVTSENVAAGAAILLDHVRQDTFKYLLVQKKFRIFGELQSIGPGCSIQTWKQYAVLKMCSEVKNVLERQLEAQRHLAGTP
jgi:hypothetical protein